MLILQPGRANAAHLLIAVRMGNWHSSPHAKGFLGDLNRRRELVSLVFALVVPAKDVVYYCFGEPLGD